MTIQSNDNMPQSASNACLDPLDALIDFSGGESYDTMSYSNTPSVSPSAKSAFSRPAGSAASNPMISPNQQPMSGPSHEYHAYKQQTGIPTGAIAQTLAVNQNPALFSYGYSSGFNAMGEENFNDFKPQHGFNSGLDMDTDFGASPSADPAYFFPEQTFINPSTIEESQPMPSVLPSQGNMNRIWPGMHQQQALAKAQAQQKQQQELIQRQNGLGQQSRHSRNGSKSSSADPIVEEKISQLLNSMRQSSVATSEGENASLNTLSHSQRMRKDEEDMDEDERLLASEEGKKLSSKERRQLRNKVSARAFRSRRKEYIGQLEGEIATKVNENSDLRTQNRALMEENTRLSDLTRMLLSSPSFSGFLDNLSAIQVAPVVPQQQVQPKMEQRQQQVRKDVNPYQQPQMHMAMIPEQNMDFSMLELPQDAYASFQPQVYAVLEVPEPKFESSVLSGKMSNLISFKSDSEKIEMPIIERLSHTKEEVEAINSSEAIDEEFNNDPAFALYHTAPAPISSPLSIDLSSLSTKIPYTLTITGTEASADSAMQRVERLCSSLDTIMERLEAYTIDY